LYPGKASGGGERKKRFRVKGSQKGCFDSSKACLCQGSVKKKEGRKIWERTWRGEKRGRRRKKVENAKQTFSDQSVKRGHRSVEENAWGGGKKEVLRGDRKRKQIHGFQMTKRLESEREGTEGEYGAALFEGDVRKKRVRRKSLARGGILSIFPSISGPRRRPSEMGGEGRLPAKRGKNSQKTATDGSPERSRFRHVTGRDIELEKSRGWGESVGEKVKKHRGVGGTQVGNMAKDWPLQERKKALGVPWDTVTGGWFGDGGGRGRNGGGGRTRL